MSDHDRRAPARCGHVLWAVLLLIVPFVAMLWVSSYNSAEPMLAGIPFFSLVSITVGRDRRRADRVRLCRGSVERGR